MVISIICLVISIALLFYGQIEKNDPTVGIICLICTLVFGFGIFCSAIPVKETSSYISPDQTLSSDTMMVAVYNGLLYWTSDALMIKRYKNGEELKVLIVDQYNSYGVRIPCERKISLAFDPENVNHKEE